MRHFVLSFCLFVIVAFTAGASNIAKSTKWLTKEETTTAYLKALNNTASGWKLLEWGWVTEDGLGEGNDMGNSSQIWLLSEPNLLQWNTGEGDFIYPVRIIGNTIYLTPKYKMVNGDFGERVGTSDEVMQVLGVSAEGTFLVIDGNRVYRVFEPIDL